MNIPLHADLPESPILETQCAHNSNRGWTILYNVLCTLQRHVLSVQELPQKRTVRRCAEHLGDLLWIWIRPSTDWHSLPKKWEKPILFPCPKKWPWAVRAHWVLPELSSELLIGCATAVGAPGQASPPVWMQRSEPSPWLIGGGQGSHCSFIPNGTCLSLRRVSAGSLVTSNLILL